MKLTHAIYHLLEIISRRQSLRLPNLSPFQSRRIRTNPSHPLSGEQLEVRLCFSAIRIVAWNTENGPDGSADAAYFRTVFQAIGNETLVGNTLAPAIVALQETDNEQGGGNSIANVESILESLYPSTNYSRAVSSLDTGRDANGFVYDDDLFDLIATSVVDETPGMSPPFAHNIFRGQFRPVGSGGENDFYLYSTHLKAGSTSTDRSRRAAEANAIRVDMDALGPNQQIIVLGDFNVQGSSEASYQRFLSAGNGQLFDPIDRPGEWNNNRNFIDIHTQNPEVNGAGGLDSRFDFQLGTAAVFDDEGLSFIPGSYQAFGNNGTHIFNSDITTGRGASPEVLTALARASDHLPVIADYDLGDNLPSVVLVETNSGTTVTEAGAGDTYTISLSQAPLANVIVDVRTDGQTRVNSQTLTSIEFTPANALTPRTIFVSAFDDNVGEGLHSSIITHTTRSADLTFDGLPGRSLQVDVLDDDQINQVGGVVITEIMYNPATTEANGDGEWVEIVNTNPSAVNLAGWVLDDEDGSNWSAIPSGTPVLPAGGVAVIHNSLISSNDFRRAWSIPDSVLVIGVSWGSLANSPTSTSEILELLDATGRQQDVVNYENSAPWPQDDGRSSIYLTDLFSDNNVGSNWQLSRAGQSNTRNPAGEPFSNADTASPGFLPQVADFGDAPSNYPNLYSAGGAYHLATGPRLGAARDTELDAAVSVLATGDDTNNIDDEDGVMFGDIVVGNSIAAVNLTLEQTSSARIDAWVDFNRDGDWDDAGEQILVSRQINRGLQTVNFDLPASIASGDTFARVRVSSTGGLTPGGSASNGEVEDVRLRIVTPRVESVVVNDGGISRSELTSIDVQFDTVVTGVNDRLQVRNLDTGEVVDGVFVSSSVINDRTLATLTFTAGDSVIASQSPAVASSLADGRYELGFSLDSTTIQQIDSFFRQFGDSDRNGSVNLADFAAFRNAFGQILEVDGDSPNSISGFDADRDGIIGLADFAAFRSVFGTQPPG